MITEHANGRTADQLLSILLERGVKIVVDIRLNPNLPFKDGYPRKGVLEKLLPLHDIRYVYFKGLGNPFKDVRDMNESKRLYQDHVVTMGDYQKVIALTRENPGSTTCLICYCNTTNPAECHRFWLKEMLDGDAIF